MSRFCILLHSSFLFMVILLKMRFILAEDDSFSETKELNRSIQIFKNREHLPLCEYLNSGNPYVYATIPAVTILYSEIFTVMSGIHFESLESTNDTYASDKEQQLIAIASTSLWNNLSYTEDVNNVFIEAIWSTWTNILESTYSNALHNVSWSESKYSLEVKTQLFANIERKIKLTNASLVATYEDEKSKAEKKLVLPIQNSTRDLKAIFKNHPRLQPFVIKLLIMKSSFERCIYDSLRKLRPDPFIASHEPKTIRVFALLEAILRLAKTGKADQVQKILDRIPQNIEKAHVVFEPEGALKVFTESLFPKLDEEFKNIPEFESERVNIEIELKKKYSTPPNQ